MTQLYPVVGSVRADDKCYGLYELNYQSPGNKGFHRYQIIVVPIGEQLYEYRRDMGLASKWKALQFRIPGAIRDEDTGKVEFVHTVGELMEIADELRAMPSPVHEPRNFKQEYVDHFEKIRKGRKGQQQFAITKHYVKN